MTRSNSEVADSEPNTPASKRQRKELPRLAKTPSFKPSGAISLMLAKKWEQGKHNPKGWLMSEKLDGIRCYWDGANMYSRGGNKFNPPTWYKAILPKDIALDGELWTTRDDFQKTVSIVKRNKGDDEDWKKIFYMVYDAPLV